MEKIRFVLSRPEVIRILEKDSSGGARRETISRLSQAEEVEMMKLTEEAVPET